MSAVRLLKRKQRQKRRMTPRAKKLATGTISAQAICQCYKVYEEHYADGTCPGHLWRKFKAR